MTFSGVVSRNTSPTTSLPSAVTSLNAAGTTLGAPLAQVASVCPVRQEALSGEESAEAPPAAEEARRFRGSVPTAGRGSGWEPADTTVSAEEHAKKITTQMGGDFWSGRRGSNSLPRPWQGRALPDELRPQTAPLLRHLGASGRSRTNDTRIFSPLLYQLSYRGKYGDQEGARTLDLQRDRLAF